LISRNYAEQVPSDELHVFFLPQHLHPRRRYAERIKVTMATAGEPGTVPFTWNIIAPAIIAIPRTAEVFRVAAKKIPTPAASCPSLRGFAQTFHLYQRD